MEQSKKPLLYAIIAWILVLYSGLMLIYTVIGFEAFPIIQSLRYFIQNSAIFLGAFGILKQRRWGFIVYFVFNILLFVGNYFLPIAAYEKHMTNMSGLCVMLILHCIILSIGIFRWKKLSWKFI